MVAASLAPASRRRSHYLNVWDAVSKGDTHLNSLVQLMQQSADSEELSIDINMPHPRERESLLHMASHKGFLEGAPPPPPPAHRTGAINDLQEGGRVAEPSPRCRRLDGAFLSVRALGLP